MKRILKISSLLLLISLVCISAKAQNPLLRYADKQFGLENYQEAAKSYEQAFEKKEKYETAKMVAESYTIMRDYQKSNEWWEKVVSFDQATREDYYEFIVSSFQAKNGDVAIEQLLDDKKFSPKDFPEISTEKLSELYKIKSNVKLVPLDELNSSGSDFGFATDKDGNSYFATDRGAVTPTEKSAIRLDLNNIYSEEKYDFNDREFFRIVRKDSTGNLKDLEVNDEEILHYSDPSFMHEKNLVFYSATRRITKAKKKKDFSVGTEILFSRIDSEGVMSNTQGFPFNDPVSFSIMHPFVDEEEMRIYFSSNMPGGEGGFDIYFVTYDDELNFGTPINLGPNINTNKNESHPYKVEEKLFFSSNGHPGFGGLDVFMADIVGGGFTNVKNLGTPINSIRDDFAYSTTADGKRYLSSDRAGGQGMDDIYSIEALNKILLAKVIDCEGDLMTEDFEVELQGDNAEKIQTTRQADGAILANLMPESRFELEISKKGYFTIEDKELTTIGLEGDTLRKEYRFAKIPYQMPVYVDIVYYDLDSSEIRKDAAITLDKLGELMQKYPFLDLLVGSHTDSRASDEYNQSLSERRASAVVGYLSKFNINKERVRAEWYGEERLTNDCGDGIPCPDSEHQLNRRSELILEAFPNPEKNYELPKEFLEKDICDEFKIFDELQKELNTVPIIYFDFDKSSIRSIHKKELERTAIMMNRMKNLSLYISGHTDQRGSVEYNKSLSERRSAVVMDYLVKRGVEAARMQYEWFGKSQPINDCDVCSESQHQENRRTELHLKK